MPCLGAVGFRAGSQSGAAFQVPPEVGCCDLQGSPTLYEWFSAKALTGHRHNILQHLLGAFKWLIPEVVCTMLLEVGSQLTWHRVHAVALRMTSCYCMPVQREHALCWAGSISQLPAMLLPAGICWGCRPRVTGQAGGAVELQAVGLVH